MRFDFRREEGAIGWLIVGILIGIAFVIWLIVQGFQLIF